MTEKRPAGRSVFLVEDEVLIRMMTAEMLEELGCHIAAEAGRLDEAISLVPSIEFDLAILDVNLGGHMISPVAALIQARHRPIIFATGYGLAGVPEDLRNHPVLRKPFTCKVLAKTIDEVLCPN